MNLLENLDADVVVAARRFLLMYKAIVRPRGIVITVGVGGQLGIVVVLRWDHRFHPSGIMYLILQDFTLPVGFIVIYCYRCVLCLKQEHQFLPRNESWFSNRFFFCIPRNILNTHLMWSATRSTRYRQEHHSGASHLSFADTSRSKPGEVGTPSGSVDGNQKSQGIPTTFWNLCSKTL